MEKIKKHRLIIIVLLVVAHGAGFFLFFTIKNRNNEGSLSNRVIINNSENPAAAENPQQGVEEKKSEESATVTPAPVKNKVVAPEGAVKTEDEAKVDGVVVKRPVNFGFQTASGRTIDTVIIHSTYNALGGDPFSADKILDIYKSYDVAAHYLIDRNGTMYQLVEDKNIAYHAGVAKLPDGRTNVNEASIGIEMINTKTDKYTTEQYAALNKLLAMIKGRYKIKYVLGHNQIAPGRKDDPWNFDWGKIK